MEGWDAKEFFKPLLAYKAIDPHPPAALQPYLRQMLSVFASGLLMPQTRISNVKQWESKNFISDKLLPGTMPHQTWLFNRRVLNARWDEATAEELATAEAYLEGYTHLTVAWIRHGYTTMLDTFRNDLCYEGYRYNKRVRADQLHGVKHRMHRFEAAGGVAALQALISVSQNRLCSSAMLYILEFARMTRAYWTPAMATRVVARLPMAAIRTYLVVTHAPMSSYPNYTWAKGVHEAKEALMTIAGPKLRCVDDFFSFGVSQFFGRRTACRRAVVLILWFIKGGRGRVRGMRDIWRNVEQRVWLTRDERAWFPPEYQREVLLQIY